MDNQKIETFQRGPMNKEHILQILKERGCRITRQRKILLDVILENEYSCCKEIYYLAAERDSTIGTATVYRMLKTLEDVGAIIRNTMYTLNREESETGNRDYRIELDDATVVQLSAAQWRQVVKQGLSACGYAKDQEILRIDRAEPEDGAELLPEAVGQ